MQIACGHCGGVAPADTFVGADGVTCCPCCAQREPRVTTVEHMAGFWPFSSSSDEEKPGVLQTVTDTAQTVSTAVKVMALAGAAVALYVVYKTFKNVGEQSKEVVKILPVVVAPEAQMAGGLSDRVTRMIAR